MRISISVTNYSWRRDQPLRDELAGVGRAADEAGLDTVWVPDHLTQFDPTVAPDDTDMLEAYSTLAFLAGRTERVRLGTLVSNVALRHPAVLVHAVTTLDALSDHRAWLGIGAGYGGEEARDLGMPDPVVRARFEQVEETLQIAHQIWTEDPTEFEGRQFHLARPHGSPRPPVRPRILVGGVGERRTLPLVARHADACNLFDIPDEGRTIRHKLDVLRACCEQIGRDADAIETTVSTRLAPDESSSDLARRCEVMTGWGVQHLIFVSSRPWGSDDLGTLADAVPMVAGLS